MDMDVVRISRRIAISAISAFALFAHPVHADTRNFALVRCDEAAGELIVKEDSTEDDGHNYKTPEGYQLKWLDDLVEYISPPGGAADNATSGTYRHKLRDWQLSCTLKGAVYSIVISPWSRYSRYASRFCVPPFWRVNGPPIKEICRACTTALAISSCTSNTSCRSRS